MGGHTVALRVEVVANLYRVARLPLVVILVHRRFEKERVAAFRAAHLINAFLNGRHKDAGMPRAHCLPHPTVDIDLRLLRPITDTHLSHPELCIPDCATLGGGTEDVKCVAAV